MANCAVVQLSDGLVVNKIVAEPTDLAPDGCQLIAIDDVSCDIGWTWNGAEFIGPNLYVGDSSVIESSGEIGAVDGD
jgi:hypothetical protein